MRVSNPMRHRSDHKVVICQQAELSSSEYLDAISKEVVTFDHITRKVTGSRGATQFSGKYEESRSALQKETEAYVSDHYATGTGGEACALVSFSLRCVPPSFLLLCAVCSLRPFAAVYNAADGCVLVISAAKYEPRNFWTGSWRSTWKAAFQAGAKGAGTHALFFVVGFRVVREIVLMGSAHAQMWC